MLSTNSGPRTPSDAAHYLWDYFYIRHYPAESERKAWRRIECATIRIRESEQLLGDKYPPAVRVKNAKRVRRAAREIVRLTMDELDALPDIEVAKALGTVEGYAQGIIDMYGDEAKRQPLN
jgi:hypothetical protein